MIRQNVMEATEERTSVSLEKEEETLAEYQQVRELLFGGEQRQLNHLNIKLLEIQQFQKQLDIGCRAIHANSVELARRLDIVEHGDEFVARHLSGALQRRNEAGGASREELASALKGPVEESLHQSIADDPDAFAETLEPIVNPLVDNGIRAVFQESGLQKLIRFRPDGSTRLAFPVTVFISLLLVALTGWLVLSIKENLLLDQAVKALSAQEGVVISVAENPALGNPRIAGLRDPLAPEPVEILQEAGIGSDNLDLSFQPFHSVDTIYAHQREQDRIKEMEVMRREIIEAAGEPDIIREVPKPGRDDFGPPGPEN